MHFKVNWLGQKMVCARSRVAWNKLKYNGDIIYKRLFKNNPGQADSRSYTFTVMFVSSKKEQLAQCHPHAPSI